MKGIDTFPKRGEASQRAYDLKNAYSREPITKAQRVIPPDECPKCGKKVGRGRYMHIKNCKG